MTWPFENDTSAVEKKLASRSINADKRRSVFVILTIALAVCLMGTLCFLYSAQQLKTLDGILGQYQAGCGGLTREEVTRDLVVVGDHHDGLVELRAGALEQAQHVGAGLAVQVAGW